MIEAIAWSFLLAGITVVARYSRDCRHCGQYPCVCTYDVSPGPSLSVDDGDAP